MKLNKYLLVGLASAFFMGSAFGQTKEQFREITKNYNLEKLQSMSDDFYQKYGAMQKEALEYAKANNLPAHFTDENGNFVRIYKLDKDNNPIYRTTFNVNAAKTIGTNKLYPGGGMGLELTGEGMLGGIWDGGRALLSHELLEYKITLKDASPDFGDHATHVAGTMVGRSISGQGAAAKGMAYNAVLNSYDWNDDLAEMTAAAANGLLLSNHSYGLRLTSIPNPILVIGAYTDESSDIDKIAYEAPYYTIVAAAGNDRGKGINNAQNGYNLLGGDFTTAKNTIVVAAVEKVENYTGPESVIMSDFSSWGPPKDFRVKPDLSADGVMVLSAIQTSPTSYAYMSGTSMATPSLSGSILLLQELSADLNNGKYLKSATVKALLVETAKLAGDHPGPDPRFGWGLANVDGAAQLMLDHHNYGNAFYDELNLNQGGTYTKTVNYSGEGDLKVTIAWTDKEGTHTPFPTPVLVNDLDLRVTDSQGNIFYPWRLDNSAMSAPALNDGDNNVDNVEKIEIPNAVQGEEYTITVTHKGELEGGSQEFSIAIMGSGPMSTDKHELLGVTLYPNPATDLVNVELDQTDGPVAVHVFDLQGRKVIDYKNEKTGQSAHRLDVSSLPAGVYFVKIQSSQKTTTKKLIIK